MLTKYACFFAPQVRKTYSGKVGGLQDDLAITLQLAITGLRCFYQVRCKDLCAVPRILMTHFVCSQSDKYQTFRPEH